jgi:dihydropteroate synthase
MKLHFEKGKPLVMGIVNLTPDSFYDGGKYSTLDSILQRVEKLIAEGASIMDIGAVSTRPGSSLPDTAEELQRLIPVLQLIKSHFPDTLLSVDTFRSEVAIQAIKEGASIINDISGGTFDDKMFETVTKSDVYYVLMHIQGTPQHMQSNPCYTDVTAEILEFFKKRIQKLNALGYDKIILDPGFGFGKTIEHNYTLLQQLPEFVKTGYPVLAGLSRKSMIYRLLNILPAEALNGTTVLNTIALLNGASLLRVHDVKEAIEAIKLTEMLCTVK